MGVASLKVVRKSAAYEREVLFLDYNYYIQVKNCTAVL